jgi:hypothetical protein
MMIFLIASMMLQGSLEEETFHPILKKQIESNIHHGTHEEAEEAKKWENRVYLATYPRSGNHWMRYLIEEATGIATSSVYCDPDPEHLLSSFPWGGFCVDGGYEGSRRYPQENELVVVKTHFPVALLSHFDRLPYKKAIRILRNPIDSFYSLYLWEKEYEPFWVKDYEQTLPEFFLPRSDLLKNIEMWRRFQEHWDYRTDVLTVRYEDLCEEPEKHLELILKTIGYTVSKQDIERALAKYPPSKGVLKHLPHYTEEDLEIIEANLGCLMDRYGYSTKTVKPPLD